MLGLGATTVTLGLPLLMRSKEWRTTEEAFTLAVEDVDRLVVKTHGGRIVLVGDPEAERIAVHATIKSNGWSESDTERAGEAIEIVTDTEGSDRILGWKWSGEKKKHWRGRVSFEVTLPEGIGVSAESHNGRIDLENVKADARLETHNGAIFADAHEGSLNIESQNGPIRIEDQRGDLTVETHNGRIDVAAIESTFRLSTHNTPINIDLSETERIEGTITTHSGKIVVSLGDESSATLDIESDNGAIKIADRVEVVSRGKDSLKAKIGDGAGSLMVKTHNGVIRVD